MNQQRNWALLAVAWIAWAASCGQAQAQLPSYSPLTPPLSPWLYMYPKTGGPVDNYHMFVQPRVQLQDTIQQQQADMANIQQQGLATGTIGEQVSQIQRERHRLVSPTGTGSVFMHYSHYFPNRSNNTLGMNNTFGGNNALGGGSFTGQLARPNTSAMPTSATGSMPLPATGMGGVGGLGGGQF